MALEKVLVVDDDPNICDVLMMYLENEGYSVFSPMTAKKHW